MNEIRPITADMRGLFDAQRAAFLQREAPSLQERRADLKKLADAIGRIGDRLEAAISADFGNRSRHETKLGEVFPAPSAIRHTLRHLAGWMRPKRVAVGLELMPASARILYQPVGVVGIISPWNYPFNLAIVPLVAALAACNRVLLEPPELTPSKSPPSWAARTPARRSPGCPSTICSTPARPRSGGWSCRRPRTISRRWRSSLAASRPASSPTTPRCRARPKASCTASF